MEIRGAIFDVDGTLLDSMPMWGRLCDNYLLGRGIQPRPDLRERVRCMSVPVAAAYLQKDYAIPASAETVLAEILAMADAEYRERLPLKPGAAAFLRALHARDVPLCVATAGDRTLADAALTRCGVRDLFVDVVTCADVGQDKGSPRIYERARERLGTARGETAVFEDALYAARTAHDAGFPVVALRDDSEPQQEALRALADIYAVDFDEVTAQLLK